MACHNYESYEDWWGTDLLIFECQGCLYTLTNCVCSDMSVIQIEIKSIIFQVSAHLMALAANSRSTPIRTAAESIPE